MLLKFPRKCVTTLINLLEDRALLYSGYLLRYDYLAHLIDFYFNLSNFSESFNMLLHKVSDETLEFLFSFNDTYDLKNWLALSKEENQLLLEYLKYNLEDLLVFEEKDFDLFLSLSEETNLPMHAFFSIANAGLFLFSEKIWLSLRGNLQDSPSQSENILQRSFMPFALF